MELASCFLFFALLLAAALVVGMDIRLLVVGVFVFGAMLVDEDRGGK